MELPIIYISEIKENQITAYGNMAEDFNPIHFDKQAAKNAGFSERVVHGMMTMGISTKLIAPWLTNHWSIKEFESSFLHPLFIGDSLTISGEIYERTCSQVRISFKGVNQEGQVIISGKTLFER
ncbi:MaoC family dehydratase [Halalkalibacter okhensis]|uniref:MaoC-like domain-containing protein n=1 Tax=Halalkalibacter okhensis TaxID=333138 RepID=A0A0B0IPW5_9BACI|nr:MaoC family dehydratase [Halalkalibacter okhensis]KHF41721.1 hypothetical protein LQ50_03220 [Halalkalibacter okhensis]